VALPVTTGDTAYRSARLIVADALGLEQKTFKSRLLICIPMFIIGIALCQLDFKVIWKYFAWLNQSLSVFTLWAVTVWLKRQQRPWLFTAVPAVFMSVVVISYIVQDTKAGFGLSMPISVAIGCLCAALFAGGSWRRATTMTPQPGSGEQTAAVSA
ncbi:MAG TPA: carbon starvation CstA 5TM domain-containing protein, partial [Candidatus Ozemobacteraceae bacterium]|nr:carbon starvation CstA 5TM domain-containing protein [Candidatus Ozemobacteraceae bacterium]